MTLIQAYIQAHKMNDTSIMIILCVEEDIWFPLDLSSEPAGKLASLSLKASSWPTKQYSVSLRMIYKNLRRLVDY